MLCSYLYVNLLLPSNCTCLPSLVHYSLRLNRYTHCYIYISIYASLFPKMIIIDVIFIPSCEPILLPSDCTCLPSLVHYSLRLNRYTLLYKHIISKLTLAPDTRITVINTSCNKKFIHTYIYSGYT